MAPMANGLITAEFSIMIKVVKRLLEILRNSPGIGDFNNGSK